MGRVHAAPQALLPSDWDWSGAKAAPSLAVGTPQSPAVRAAPGEQGLGAGWLCSGTVGATGAVPWGCSRAMMLLLLLRCKWVRWLAAAGAHFPTNGRGRDICAMYGIVWHRGFSSAGVREHRGSERKGGAPKDVSALALFETPAASCPSQALL